MKCSNKRGAFVSPLPVAKGRKASRQTRLQLGLMGHGKVSLLQADTERHGGEEGGSLTQLGNSMSIACVKDLVVRFSRHLLR